MTTPKTFAEISKEAQGRFRLPDPPQREPDEMTSYDKLHKTGNSRYLALHLGNPDTTLVEAERWMVADESFNKSRARRPDLLVAFGVDPATYEANNGYVVSEQGKPPDFVLEVASESTAEIDVGEKRWDYAALGITEYWRFDETGEYHGERLAGERLVEGEYAAIEIEELPGGSLQGYSAALNLYLHWERGELRFYDPQTGQPITTLEDERARAHAAEIERNAEREARAAAEAERNAEREARAAAEAERNAEREARAAAEAELRRLRERLDQQGG